MGVPDDAANHLEGGAQAEGPRQPRDRGAAQGRQRGPGPLGGELAGAGHHLIVRCTLGPEKPEHGGERGEPHPPVLQAFGAEPFLVELDALRQDVGNRLMQARGEETTDTGLCHDRPVATDLSAAVLAGGQARRLGGRDKSRLVVRGRSIIVRQLDVLQRVSDDVFLVSSFAERHADLGLPVYPDVVAGAGAIGGVLTALERARHELVLVVACDLPFLKAPLLLALADLARRADGAWPATSRGVEPLAACYQRRVRDVLRARIDAGRLKLMDLDRVLRMARLEGEALAACGAPEEIFANVNTLEDLERVQGMESAPRHSR